MNFTNNIISIYGSDGQVWLNTLPDQVQDYCKRWGIGQIIPQSNLTHNYVVYGTQDGQHVCLKIGVDPGEIAREYQALKAFENYGGVRCIHYHSHAILMERLIPGLPISQYTFADPSEKLTVLCSIMQRLNQATIPPTHPFKNIVDELTILDHTWDIPGDFLNQARVIVRDISQLNMPLVLLHGDLHDDNILCHGTGWKVIDPKGFIGYPINEMWAFIRNPESDTSFIANHFNWPVNLVRNWYFVHMILNACWALQDNLNPTLFLNCAHKIAPYVIHKS